MAKVAHSERDKSCHARLVNLNFSHMITLQETATYIPHTLDAFTKKIELVSVPNLMCK